MLKTCPKNNISIVIETFSRRVIIMPLYIPLVSILISFMLVYTKNKKTKILNRYIFFLLSFVLLVLSELLVRYSGISKNWILHLSAHSFFIVTYTLFYFNK